MKKSLSVFKFFAVLVFSTSLKLYAQPHDNMGAKHILVNAGKLNWVNGPASLLKGAKLSILEGDMSKSEPFTVRLMLPPNYKVPPHWHPAIEHVTVIQGAFYMGAGEKFNESIATKLSVGDLRPCRLIMRIMHLQRERQLYSCMVLALGELLMLMKRMIHERNSRTLPYFFYSKCNSSILPL